MIAMATSEELKMAGDIFKWRSTFDRFDADGSGFVDGDELMDMVKELVGHVEASSTEVADLMKALDESSDGEVSWDEFRAPLSRTLHSYSVAVTPGSIVVGMTNNPFIVLTRSRKSLHCIWVVLGWVYCSPTLHSEGHAEHARRSLINNGLTTEPWQLSWLRLPRHRHHHCHR